MGASQGKTKSELKEEARMWAENKDVEITTLYGENTKLANELRLLHVDIQAMKRTMEQQQLVIENMSKENAANCEKKSPRRVHFEEEQEMCCCPTTQEAHDAELQRIFDDEWDLVVSSHAIVTAQRRCMPGGKLYWAMLDDEGEQAAKLLEQYGNPESSIEEMRRQVFDVRVKLNKELFKFQGNHFRSVTKALFRLRQHAASAHGSWF